MSSTSERAARALGSARLLAAALLALLIAAVLTIAYSRLVMHEAPGSLLDVVGAVAWAAGLCVPLLVVGAALTRLVR